jgi:hypothetical protein
VARGGSVEQITDAPDDTSRSVPTSNVQARAADSSARLEASAAGLPCNIRPNDPFLLTPMGVQMHAITAGLSGRTQQ